MSLSTPTRTASARFARLMLYKALFLFSITLFSLLLIAARPVQAQGGWVTQPCNAQGNPFTPAPQPDSAGFYVMGGTLSETTSNGYSPDMINAAIANPNSYGYYLNAGSPLGPGTAPATQGGISAANGIGNYYLPIPGLSSYYYSNASTYNYAPQSIGGPDGTFYYSVTTPAGAARSGIINGSATVDLTGQLVYYFKTQWQGMGAPTSPIPDHLNLLLRTGLYAGAGVSYNGSAQKSGLSASSKASDGSPFNETATAAAGDAGAASGPGSVQGFHLVTASVDPKTGISQTYLNGTAHWAASNSVPYGTVTFPYPNYPTYPVTQQTNGPTSAGARSSVQCGVKLDSRNVTISSSLDTTYRRVAGSNGSPATSAANGLNPIFRTSVESQLLLAPVNSHLKFVRLASNSIGGK